MSKTLLNARALLPIYEAGKRISFVLRKSSMAWIAGKRHPTFDGFCGLRTLARARGGFPPENASYHLGTIAATRFLEQMSHVILYGRMRNTKIARNIAELRAIEQHRQYFDLARRKTKPDGTFR